MLRSVDWYLVTDVSGRPIDAIFKPKKMRPNTFPKTSVTKQQSKLRNIPEERMYYSVAFAKKRITKFKL
jgi:hypothetical protein